MTRYLALLALMMTVMGCYSAPKAANYRVYSPEQPGVAGTETWYWMETYPRTKAGVCAAMFGGDRPGNDILY